MSSFRSILGQSWNFEIIKGQLISKAIYCLLTSPKKQTNEFVLFALLLFMANKSNSSVRFLGESTARQSTFRFYLTFSCQSIYSVLIVLVTYTFECSAAAVDMCTIWQQRWCHNDPDWLPSCYTWLFSSRLCQSSCQPESHYTASSSSSFVFCWPDMFITVHYYSFDCL